MEPESSVFDETKTSVLVEKPQGNGKPPRERLPKIEITLPRMRWVDVDGKRTLEPLNEHEAELRKTATLYGERGWIFVPGTDRNRRVRRANINKLARVIRRDARKTLKTHLIPWAEAKEEAKFRIAKFEAASQKFEREGEPDAGSDSTDSAASDQA